MENFRMSPLKDSENIGTALAAGFLCGLSGAAIPGADFLRSLRPLRIA